MIIDCHGHYTTAPGDLQIFRDAQIANFEDAAKPAPRLADISDDAIRETIENNQLRALKERGADMTIFSPKASAMAHHIGDEAISITWSRINNDLIHRVVQLFPDFFAGVCQLPQSVGVPIENALAELERCVTELGFKGFMLLSNASGVPLADERFEPLYERADHHGVVFYIHPTYPLGVEAMEDYMLMPLVGFLFDTTLATAHLVYAGVPERYPNIRWVLCHTGGAIPFLAERLDRGYEAFSRCRERISEPPSEYLKRFYYDTVNFDPKALRLAVDFAGVDQIVAGSDYPHMVGSLDKMKSTIAALGLSAEDEAKVLGKNAERLLSL